MKLMIGIYLHSSSKFFLVIFPIYLSAPMPFIEFDLFTSRNVSGCCRFIKRATAMRAWNEAWVWGALLHRR